MQGKLKMKDLWKHANQGLLKKSFTAEVAPHGVVMLKISHANGNG